MTVQPHIEHLADVRNTVSRKVLLQRAHDFAELCLAVHVLRRSESCPDTVQEFHVHASPGISAAGLEVPGSPLRVCVDASARIPPEIITVFVPLRVDGPLCEF